MTNETHKTPVRLFEHIMNDKLICIDKQNHNNTTHTSIHKERNKEEKKQPTNVDNE